MSGPILGVDISKRKFDVALVKEGQWASATFSNDRQGFHKLRRWLKKRKVKNVWACLEATGRYGEELVQALYENGHQVSIVNPVQIKKYAESRLQRNKTDKLDAKLIADYCLRQEPPLWTPLPIEQLELKAMVRRLEALLADRTRELNRLQAGQYPPVVIDSIKSHLSFLDDQIAQLESQINDHIDEHPDLHQNKELLTSIPGIGDKTAARLLGELPDLDGFRSSSQLVAYAGLSPHQHHSGSSVHRPGRLTYIGKRSIRNILFFPALVAQRHNPIIRAQKQRLQQRGKKKMVMVGAAMRKLLQLVYGVLKSRKPFDPNYVVNVQSSS